jgi:hypothetical protein
MATARRITISTVAAAIVIAVAMQLELTFISLRHTWSMLTAANSIGASLALPYGAPLPITWAACEPIHGEDFLPDGRIIGQTIAGCGIPASEISTAIVAANVALTLVALLALARAVPRAGTFAIGAPVVAAWVLAALESFAGGARPIDSVYAVGVDAMLWLASLGLAAVAAGLLSRVRPRTKAAVG